MPAAAQSELACACASSPTEMEDWHARCETVAPGFRISLPTG
jgi:hypothetical protein